MSLDTTYTHQQQNCKNQVTDIYGAQLGAHFVNSTTPNKINVSQNVHLNVPVANKRNQNPQTTPSICEASHTDNEETMGKRKV